MSVTVGFVCPFLDVKTWPVNGKWEGMEGEVDVVGEGAGVGEAGEVGEVDEAVGTLDAGIHSYYH